MALVPKSGTSILNFYETKRMASLPLGRFVFGLSGGRMQNAASRCGFGVGVRHIGRNTFFALLG
jgi:hypothetical protein